MPNPSFEEYNICPNVDNTYTECSEFWFAPNASTTDLFNGCATIGSGYGVPENIGGFQGPEDGLGYSGIVLYTSSISDYREYLAVRLTDTLKANTNYCLKFYVCLSELYPKYISSIGVHFSPDSIHQDNWGPLTLAPQFENFNGNFINDTTAWLLIKGNYIAAGGEKYIYIGNFRNDANTVVDSASVGSRTYVYVDNIQLYECDSLIGIKEESVTPIQIYPNPANGMVTIQTMQAATIKLYNATGQLVLQSTLPQVDCSPLPNGLYVAQVQQGNTISYKRLVIQH